MSLTLNTNVSSLNTQNWLSVNTAAQAKAAEQLSSGYKINDASDDPAGYAIAFKLGVKSAVLQTSINNANQGTAMLQVAQGAMQQIGNILTQLKQTATEAASANNSDPASLASLDNQRSALETQIDNINTSTQYNGAGIFGTGNTYTTTLTPTLGAVGIDVSGYSAGSGAVYTVTATASSVTLTSNAAGTPSQTVSNTAPTGLDTATLNFSTFGINLTVNANQADAAGTITVTAGTGALKFQVGDVSNAVNQVSVTLGQVNHGVGGLGLTGNLTSATSAGTYMGQIDTAITALDTAESAAGAAQDQLAYQAANLTTMNTNTQAAASTVKDTDYASAMSNFAKYQIATQAGVAMLSQANQLPQQILSLIKAG